MVVDLLLHVMQVQRVGHEDQVVRLKVMIEVRWIDPGLEGILNGSGCDDLIMESRVGGTPPICVVIILGAYSA
jgi:hypothetical protein